MPALPVRLHTSLLSRVASKLSSIIMYNCDFMFVCLSVCLLVCWSVGLLVCWSVGLLVCWSVGLLVCRGGTIHRCIDESRYFSRDTYRDIISQFLLF